ncbi:MAG: RDD family protein [Deltaproteobacteria bacterium]|nr:RDD family protein [Deltaproteobacteria bacterium]
MSFSQGTAQPDDRFNQTDPSIHSRLTVYDGLSVRFKPAPFGKRLLAYIVDLSIVSAIMYIPVLIFIFVAIAAAAFASSAHLGILGIIGLVILIIIAVLIFASIYHGYFIYFEYKRGQTFGKRIFSLKVVSLKGGRLTLGQCVLRDLIRYIDCSMIFPGLIAIIASERGQRLGDFAAQTLVTHYSTKELSREAQYMNIDEYHQLLETTHPTAMQEKEMKKFLGFAFAAFIIQTKIPSAKKIADVAAHIREHYFGSEPQGIDNTTIVRFYAEYCFRKTNKLSSTLNPKEIL